MAKKSSNNSCCALCEGSNLASACASCVNYKLNEFRTTLRLLKKERESLYTRLNDALEAKRHADDQVNWRVSKNEKLKKMNEHLTILKKQLLEEKAKVDEVLDELKLTNSSLEYAYETLKKNRASILETLNNNLIYKSGAAHMTINSERLVKQSMIVKQICKLFPIRQVNIGDKNNGYSGSYDQICNARLPRGLDPHSVPAEELSASLGFMVQLLNLVIPTLAAPALHNSGFAGSCSRIWQRDSYWDARPSSPSKEYPLFIPRQNFCSSGGENSWSDRSSYNFGVSSMESEKKPNLDDSRSSFSYPSGSHSLETHKDLQIGILLLKKSVACINAYCYNTMGLDVPSEASTFEAFAKLLATLSSSKALPSTRTSLKMVESSRSDKQTHQLNRSAWNETSGISSSSLLESTQTAVLSAARESIPSSMPGFIRTSGMPEMVNPESLVEEWDLVEHPTVPSPSQDEDVEQWMRAMFVDATKK